MCLLGGWRPRGRSRGHYTWRSRDTEQTGPGLAGALGGADLSKKQRPRHFLLRPNTPRRRRSFSAPRAPANPERTGDAGCCPSLLSRAAPQLMSRSPMHAQSCWHVHLAGTASEIAAAAHLHAAKRPGTAYCRARGRTAHAAAGLSPAPRPSLGIPGPASDAGQTDEKSVCWESVCPAGIRGFSLTAGRDAENLHVVPMRRTRNGGRIARLVYGTLESLNGI